MSYNKFLSTEMHEKKQGGVDFKIGFRYEYWDIGMVRNARPENKKRMKVYVDPSPHVILEQNVPLRGWYKSKYEKKGVRARPCFTEALLTQPYGGTCPVNCIFCYINNGIRGYRGQGITVVDLNYPKKCEEQLKKMKFGWNLYISSFTEPFQKLESIYHNTEQLSKIAIDFGLPIFYLTRLIPPDWAINNLLKNKYSYQQFSIITSDRTDYKKFSPNAATLDDLLKVIKEEKKMGIYISVQINPILAGIIDNHDIEKLIYELAKIGTDHVIFKFVEIVSPAAKFMVEKIRKIFPDRAKKFEDLFSETIGGMRTIKESYRLKSLDFFKKICQKAGITMATCYEYKYEKDENGKIKDKAGISIGKEYCTADQCHGMKTPLFIKEGNKFVPFENCPPTGCLYCQEQYDFPPCKNIFLQQAHALKASDYNHVEY